MKSSAIETVRLRAVRQCEHCLLPDLHVAYPFKIEHIIPIQHGSTDSMSNLAYACLHCNRHKGPNLSGLDRKTSRTKPIRLFHPRQHRWQYHFALESAKIIGRSAIGRVTVQVLNTNDPLLMLVRYELMEEGLYPSG